MEPTIGRYLDAAVAVISATLEAVEMACMAVAAGSSVVPAIAKAAAAGEVPRTLRVERGAEEDITGLWEVMEVREGG
jgi:hypothetical protein